MQHLHATVNVQEVWVPLRISYADMITYMKCNDRADMLCILLFSSCDSDALVADAMVNRM